MSVYHRAQHNHAQCVIGISDAVRMFPHRPRMGHSVRCTAHGRLRCPRALPPVAFALLAAQMCSSPWLPVWSPFRTSQAVNKERPLASDPVPKARNRKPFSYRTNPSVDLQWSSAHGKAQPWPVPSPSGQGPCPPWRPNTTTHGTEGQAEGICVGAAPPNGLHVILAPNCQTPSHPPIPDRSIQRHPPSNHPAWGRTEMTTSPGRGARGVGVAAAAEVEAPTGGHKRSCREGG